MEKDKNSAVDEFLGDLKNNDGDGVFEASKENPFGEANIVEPKEDVVEEEVKDKPLPFNRDPKVLKFIEKEVSKRLKDFTPPKEETPAEKQDRIDDVLTRIIGNDTPDKISAIKDLKEVLLEREEKGAERALRQLDARREAEEKADQEALEQLEQGFDDIETNFNVDLTSNSQQARKLKAELVDFVERVAPKDANGEVIEFPDFIETFKLFQELKKPAPNTINRALASRSMTRSGDVSNTKAPRDYSWKGVEKTISEMFK